MKDNTIPYTLTYSQLRADLMLAYLDARRHKRNRRYQLDFEANLERNLDSLCQELYSRNYRPLPSECFIITDPKKREVFAAAFRDRIVHHLYYNYVHRMFERTFIHDSYSCIKGRGTHYGISRLEGHIRKESQNYSQPCYVLKMDIRGYFMHINRSKLLEICLRTIDRMSHHRIGKYRNERWIELVDMDFVKYLTQEIVTLDCTLNCHIKGSPADWNGLDNGKSLFTAAPGCGLPIGNLTSQLFSNIYLNELDQFMKRELHCRHYGRYVDDFYVVSADRSFLHSLISKVRTFLSDVLGLELHKGKLRIDNVRYGVEFLGAFVKPWHRLLSSITLRRMIVKIERLSVMVGKTEFRREFGAGIRSSLNSFCGVMGHYKSFHIRKRIWNSRACSVFTLYGQFDSQYMRFISIFAVYSRIKFSASVSRTNIA